MDLTTSQNQGPVGSIPNLYKNKAMQQAVGSLFGGNKVSSQGGGQTTVGQGGSTTPNTVSPVVPPTTKTPEQQALADTLAYSTLAPGTDVPKFLEENPAARQLIEESIRIQTGQKPVKAPSVFSSEDDSVQDQANIDKYNAEQQALADKQANEAAVKADELARTPSGTLPKTPVAPGTEPISEAEKTNAELKAISDQNQQQYDSFIQQLTDIKTGTFDLTPSEQAQLDQIQAMIERQRQQMIDINTAQTNAVKILGIRAGRQRYATEVDTGNIGAEIAAGAARIRDIENNGLSLMNAARDAIATKRMDLLDAAMTAFENNQNRRQTIIQQMSDNLRQAEQMSITQAQEAREALMTDVAGAQLKKAQTLAPGLISVDTSGNLVMPDEETLAAFAKEYDVPEDILRSALEMRKDQMTELAYQGMKASGAGTSEQDRQDVLDIATGIMNGDLPPTTTGLYGKSAAVKAELARQGFDLTTAGLEYAATMKYVSNVNSTAQIRMRQAEASVEQSLGNLETLNNEFARTGWKFVNKAELIAATNGLMGPEKAKQAQALLGQIALITDELGQTFMGGNSPTEAAFALAQQVFEGDFSQETLTAQIAMLKQNLQYRKTAWAAVKAVGGLPSQEDTTTGSGITPAQGSADEFPDL